MKTNL